MKLFDQFGREIEIQKKPETREIAVTTVRDRWSNYPSQGLTPQKLAAIFKEADNGDVYRQAELFEEMEEKDAHLFSVIQTRKNAVLGLEYDVQPYSDSAEDKKIRDFVAEDLFALPNLDDALLDLLDAIGKGYALEEIIWGVDGGRAVISDLRWIHAKKAVFYREWTQGGGRGTWEKSFECPRIITDQDPINGELMPPWKLVYHKYKARSGYDTRAGILRTCAWMYLFKNYGIKDWVAFTEVFGMPLRLGKYDAGASKEDKDSLVAAIQSLGSDAAGIISKSTEIEFVEVVKNSGTDNVFEVLANFCDKQISKAVLGQTASTEGTPGKLGNEEAQDKVRQDLVEADCAALGKTIRGQVIRPLVGYNFGWDKPFPWFQLQFDPPEDLKILSEVYVNVHGIGQPISPEHVSERFKIPLPKEGEGILPAAMGAPLALKAQRAEGRGQRSAGSGQRLVIGALNDLNAGIKQAPDWVVRYMEKLRPSMKAVRQSALDEIETWLRGLPAPPSVDEFVGRIEQTLITAYPGIDKQAVAEGVAEIYSFHKINDLLSAGAKIGFGGADARAVNFLSKLDDFYLSKFVSNPDAQGALKTFLEQRYLDGGSQLFRGGDPQAIAELKNLLGQNLTDLEEYQVRRIVDTGVQRVRNWAHTSQLNEAGIAEIEIVEPTRECDFCDAMNGKIIRVEAAYQRMRSQMEMSPEEYEAELKRTAPQLANIESFVDQGLLPPYHPHCHGRIIKRIGH